MAVDLDIAAGVLAVDHFVADGDGEAGPLAILEQFAGAERHHVAALRLLLRRIGQDDAAGRPLFGLDRLHHHTVIERTDLQVLRSHLRSHEKLSPKGKETLQVSGVGFAHIMPGMPMPPMPPMPPPMPPMPPIPPPMP